MARGPADGERRDPYSPTLLEGDRILVTGGGSGLGKAIAGALVAHGAEVVLWGRRRAVLDAAASEIAMLGDPSRIVVDSVDVRDAEAVDAAVDRMHAGGRPLTGLVNGAAANFIAPTESLSARAFAAVTSTVINGSFHVTHAVGRRWIREGLPGAVVSLLTTWVETGSAYVVPSAMSKAAVNAMTMSLAVEWAHYGIRLNAVAPGPVPTEFAWDVLDPGDSSVIGATDVRGVPAGRFGRPDEVANLVMFLLSDACDYLTGETIAMDGGQRLAGPSTFSDLTHLTADDWAAIRARGKAAAAATKAQQAEGAGADQR
ncbi:MULTISPECIES: SDR family oxidoreductase [unclassified Curtobacterium]|uniref:SDR family oxidoreductase n=1 Tax=unclassified Curtobacterium TaxID=257496 RepID=UPI000DAA17F8|nr:MULTISPECIES: SDR family oxidoreductase [unclassified Curtobacterium]PZE25629.1 oxidoreductase [Curtobacterium sp. MCBD17_028]PZE78501.1 oxidoreductase [Curtobacterium sp. MCBD17_019]PZF57114.1 oxidoreductase [Curtobacterium sp. MCBD17_034]PZM33536.1 oxidoreductase [Curtobacterium sp. MCBD17_031]WIB68183.1 SDR family oxidoreductase [Curtobacterium sp. MCBD17_035]